MMKAFLSGAIVIAVAVSAQAQPRPLAGTTLVTTDTSVTSICAGANTINAPTTCLGGLQAGPVVVNQAITIPTFIPGVTTNKLYQSGGTLFFSGSAIAVGGAVGPGTIGKVPLYTGANSIGDSLITQAGTVLTAAATLASTVFGASSFTAGGVGDQSLTIRNTTAGVANRGVLFVGNDTSAFTGKLAAYASTFTTSGADIANGVKLEGQGVGGLSLRAADATGILHFFTGTGTVERGQITAAGLFTWTTFGVHTFTAGGAGANAVTVANPTAGAGNLGSFAVLSDTVTTGLNSFSSTYTTSGANVQAGTALSGNGTGGISITANAAAGAVRIYTGSGTLRATFDATGNFNLGSTNIMDAPSVPTMGTVTGGTATIAGRATGFRVTIASGTVTAMDVNLNTTYANTVACSASVDHATTATANVFTTTGAVTLAFSVGLVTNDHIYVLCRGY